jgi:hypothetical protein
MGLLDLPLVAQWDGLLCGGTCLPAMNVHSVCTPPLMGLLDLLLVAWWGGLLHVVGHSFVVGLRAFSVILCHGSSSSLHTTPHELA